MPAEWRPKLWFVERMYARAARIWAALIAARHEAPDALIAGSWVR